MHSQILIYSGSLAGISAALDLKSQGKEVLLFTHRNYLGEDLCDSLRLALPADLSLDHPLAQRLYGKAVAEKRPLRPMEIKHVLDQVLAEADIPVMLGSAPVKFLSDDAGNLSGLRVHNRSGDFDLAFDTLIDGSLQGDLLRLAGLPFSDPAAEINVIRRVIGGVSQDQVQWQAEAEVEFTNDEGTQCATLWAHHYSTTLQDGSWGAWMDLEQQARIKAYRPGQDLSADGIFAFTGETLFPETECLKTKGDVTQIPATLCSALQGKLWATGSILNVDQDTRDALIRHDHAISFGQHIASMILATAPATCPLTRPSSPPEISLDVLVMGGGTGGAPAAIAAARSGKKTLVAEYLSGLGGVGTLGLIGRYWFGNRVGFTAEIDQGAQELTTKTFRSDSWDVEAKMQWYHQQITKAGGHIWYKTMLSRAIVEGNRVKGAVLCTPRGEITINAKCVVDASGAAEVAYAAGAQTVSIGQGRLALQGTGLPGRNPGSNYTNTDYDFVDDSDAKDMGSAHVTAREKFKQAFDAGQHLDSRERRRVVGDYEITPMDIRLSRIFPDTVVRAQSNFDTHGYTVHPLFMIVPPDHDEQIAYIPLRSLLPKGLNGILVTGLGISAHRDAMPVIRMQADVQNQGYAAGMIAAMAGDQDIRSLDIQEIQSKLVDTGILNPEIKGAPDSFPLSDDEIEQGIQTSLTDPNTIDRVFTLPPEQALDKIRSAFLQATDEKAKAHFAFILGILEDASGIETLTETVKNTPWDKGWNYTGMGQFGESMSTLDAHIIALGRCKDPKTLPVLKTKAESLPEDAAFSHYRVLAEAFETINDPAGAAILQTLLEKPGITGHHLHSTTDRLATITDNSEETAFRNHALIELHLATSLYQLDPQNDVAIQIMQNYARDLRGVFAAHANRFLNT
ncbi:FAD-dependent oxidoreductase [Kiritimatiellota bacterium B12222]|nr:FAD-dependent oxidoreductase [Kiritimatiellota bacterium B12222]